MLCSKRIFEDCSSWHSINPKRSFCRTASILARIFGGIFAVSGKEFTTFTQVRSRHIDCYVERYFIQNKRESYAVGNEVD
jgi:hypothetical protein